MIFKPISYENLFGDLFLLFGIHAHSQSRDILIQDFNAGMVQLDSMSSNQPALSFEILPSAQPNC
ncbi:MAG: hypothetical protein IPN26_11990 [Bacteroidetes bacterium]|nr:hypothetical protein [Bacteroidota bacterium]